MIERAHAILERPNLGEETTTDIRTIIADIRRSAGEGNEEAVAAYSAELIDLLMDIE